MKWITDRLGYALVGIVLGGIAGAVLWYLLDFTKIGRLWTTTHLGWSLREWVTRCGAAFGLVGLVFGSHVGTALGGLFDLLFGGPRSTR